MRKKFPSPTETQLWFNSMPVNSTVGNGPSEFGDVSRGVLLFCEKDRENFCDFFGIF